MADDNISQEFRSKEIYKTRNYFIEKIKQNELISKMQKQVWWIWNYSEHLLTLTSRVTGCVSISALTFLVGISVDIPHFSISIKISIITAEI